MDYTSSEKGQGDIYSNAYKPYPIEGEENVKAR